MSDIIKVVEKCATDTSDYRNALVITKNDKDILSFRDGEPEDSNLSRDFNGCYRIINLLEEFYKYGKEGKVVEFSSIEVEWDNI